MDDQDDEVDASQQKSFGETGYWGVSGAGCLILARETGRILLPRRGEDTAEPFTWGTWGGATHPGETPLETALREANAEAGHPLCGDNAVLLWVYRDPEVGFTYHTYLIPVEHEFVPRLNWESSQAEWFVPGNWPEPLHPGLLALLRAKEATQILTDSVAAATPGVQNRTP